ncbi:hypothetical protein BU26DRAFT_543939 [Trematosphaeria pertusa]|uniref:catechol O-methyltransferase n=1 Tax=Trematosphaeria pertusa TaxID=390896 RepID=A0A6A6HX87_9PLEO|nr:uncharacterized protein BU26DRAFT_543939 [Trematosphaeria pertusa]KAF2242814.1 hypothetical protein BU26DRAFT_543939 [Trematosphaeria pertusa]
MGSFDQAKAYAPQEDTFFDDGREIELLHFVYSHPDLKRIRGSPQKVLAAIDEYARTKKYLMNVGEDKGRIVTDLIAEVKPETMVELGGYVGYSCILFGDAVRKAGGRRYYSLERNPEFAAVIMSLVDLAGLSDLVKVVVGSSDESVARLHSFGALKHIDLMFLDHYKPAYTTDLKLCEELKLVTPGSVLAADNVIKPGNPPYLEYVRGSVEEKRKKFKENRDGVTVEGIAERTVKQYANKYSEEKFSQSQGNPNLAYDSKLVNSYEPTGVPNLLLVFLSFICIPISSAIVFFSLISSKLRPQPRPLRPHDALKTILVTGVSMTKGLTIARLLSQHTPHRIIGADISSFSPGRFSASLSSFYKLTPPDGKDVEPYIDSLLELILDQKVDLWISCSSVVAAVEDGEVVRLAERERGAAFKAVQFHDEVVGVLYEKDLFIEYIASLGLLVPESYRCTSAELVLSILLNQQQDERKKFILKPIGVGDKARGNMMTLLPFPSPQDTAAYVKSLDVSSSNPLQLQQFINGHEYCTHALIVRGRVMAFVACPSSDMLMHYEALSPDSYLSREMLAFTQRVAEDGGEDFTGHLSFDFLVEGEGRDIQLYPIECNPRAHTAVVLFADTPQMAGAYLSVFESDETLDTREIVVPRLPTHSYYWLGHDIVTLLVLPVLALFSWQVEFEDVIDAGVEFWEHVLCWRDGMFALWDPVPFFVLYHVYWPMQFLNCVLKGQGWSRVNVSTTKVFQS